jgi:hypothetical protein
MELKLLFLKEFDVASTNCLYKKPFFEEKDKTLV